MINDKAVFDLPDGPKNLAELFPAIDWAQVKEYQVLLKDDTDAVLVSTPINVLTCGGDDYIRVVYESRLGRFDAVNFSKVRIIHEPNSGEFKKSLPDVHDKMETGIERFNVRSNRTYEATTVCYNEGDMKWLSEAADSSKAFLQFNGHEGQADTFLPIRILDGKHDLKKADDDFQYPFTIQFKMANETNNLRS